LWRWLALREAMLASVLGQSLILFGEWCYAEHSVPYSSLPDWFLAFDIYDRRSARFWSRVRRDTLAREAGLAIVPLLAEGTFSLADLKMHLGRSRLGEVAIEGIYLRWDENDWLVARAKVVRSGWVMSSDEHWSARPLKTNRLAPTAVAAGRGRA
jgi:hypothetical protein